MNSNPASDSELLAATDAENPKDPRLLQTHTSYDPEKRGSVVTPLMFSLIPGAIGYGLAVAIYHVDQAKHDEHLTILAQNNLHFLYFAGVLLALLTKFLNFFPAGLKDAAMRGQARGNIRANMYLYKVSGPAHDSLPPVILEDEGAAGRYNRANRSLHHYVENSLPVFLATPLAGFAFPAAVFVLVAIFCVARVMHQVGYPNKGYGGHGAGFGLALLATVILEGLVLVAGLRAAGVPQ
jgi:uncharacterized membrane protein YecN with MAPEG domain